MYSLSTHTHSYQMKNFTQLCSMSNTCVLSNSLTEEDNLFTSEPWCFYAKIIISMTSYLFVNQFSISSINFNIQQLLLFSETCNIKFDLLLRPHYENKKDLITLDFSTILYVLSQFQKILMWNTYNISMNSIQTNIIENIRVGEYEQERVRNSVCCMQI